jgi:hypothetical protein
MAWYKARLVEMLAGGAQQFFPRVFFGGRSSREPLDAR